MAKIPTYHVSIPSLAEMLEDQGVRNLGLIKGLTNEIREGEQVNYANSALAREELDLLLAYHAKDPHTFNKSLVGMAQVRSSMVDHLHAKVLFPDAAFPAVLPAVLPAASPLAASLEGVKAELAVTRTDFAKGLREVKVEIALANARMMNWKIRKDNRKTVKERGFRPPIPVHKIVAGSGLEKAQGHSMYMDIYFWNGDLKDTEAQIGDVPNLPKAFLRLENEDILNLISFYNEDFGITDHMNLETKRTKVQAYFH